MKTLFKNTFKKLTAVAAVVFLSSGFAIAEPSGNSKKLSAIRNQVKNQIKIPASLKNKGLNEKAIVNFVIEGNKITSYKIETSNSVLKENLSHQFEKMKINLEKENAAGSYEIELSFKVI